MHHLLFFDRNSCEVKALVFCKQNSLYLLNFKVLLNKFYHVIELLSSCARPRLQK